MNACSVPHSEYGTTLVQCHEYVRATHAVSVCGPRVTHNVYFFTRE